MPEPLLTVENLQVRFPTPRGEVQAVRGISFAVEPGEVLGIVGESGCGKTATGRAIMRLLPPPGRIAGGRILYRGQDLTALDEAAMRRLRGRRIAMVFQDPGAALNPLFTIGAQLLAIIGQHRLAAGAAARARAADLLGEVGLPNPAEVLSRYPHQLSGGMQQRAMLAMALAAEPELIIADEATAALDVTIQAQILELLAKLRRERNLTMIFITHDLGVVAEICDRVAVLYLGRIVEEGGVDGIFGDTRHPYSRGLLAAIPTTENWGRPLAVIPGAVPAGTESPSGCAFAARCDSAMDRCRAIDPPVVGFPDRQQVACHLYQSGAGEG